jgi:hypothetical protein
MSVGGLLLSEVATIVFGVDGKSHLLLPHENDDSGSVGGARESVPRALGDSPLALATLIRLSSPIAAAFTEPLADDPVFALLEEDGPGVQESLERLLGAAARAEKRLCASGWTLDGEYGLKRTGRIGRPKKHLNSMIGALYKYLAGLRKVHGTNSNICQDVLELLFPFFSELDFDGVHSVVRDLRRAKTRKGGRPKEVA